MAVNVIVVNPVAKRLKEDGRIRKRIREAFSAHAHIIDPYGRDQILSELTHAANNNAIEAIYVVGGDGTFNLILNWIIRQPPDARPSMILVGGGQFCYMTRFHGFRNRNPIHNLKEIFSGRIALIPRGWRPVHMIDSLSKTSRYAAVFANGVVCDVSEWYESVGKGGLTKVVGVISGAILSVLSEKCRRLQNRIRLLEGELVFDSKIVKPQGYAGFTFGAVSELVTTCRPFRGTPNPYQFSAIAYWGNLRRLAFAAPFIWFGWTPPWIRRRIFNEPIHMARVTTTDPRLVVDGDLIRLEGSKPNKPRSLTFTSDEMISLLVVRS